MKPRYQLYENVKSSSIKWLGDIPAHWKTLPGHRLFGERKERMRAGDEMLTASQKYGVIPQVEFMRREDQKVMQVYLNAEILKHVEPNDFVISMRSFQGGLEFCAYSGCVSSAYVGIFALKHVEPVFFKYLFKSDPYIQALQSTSNLVRDGQALRFQNFSMVRLPVIPKAEQKQIAAFLDYETAKIDALIEKQQQLIALLGEKRQAVISHAVTKGLNPDAPMRDSGVGWLGKVPAHWIASKLKHHVWQIVDGAHFTPTYVETGVPFLRVTDVQTFPIDQSTIKYIPEAEHKELVRRCCPQRGDLLLSKNGTIGVPRIVEWDWEFSIFVSLCLIKLKKSLDVRFLYYFFLTHQIREQIFGLIKQSTVINLHLDKIENFWLAIPPLDEQKEIVQYLDKNIGKYDIQIELAEAMNELLQERRTALISAAVTGKIDVRDWKPPSSEPTTEVETS